MGNRSSSTSKLKQNPDGNRTAANNGMRSPRNNDVSHTQTKANEVADVQPSLNHKIHRSVSEIDQVTRLFVDDDGGCYGDEFFLCVNAIISYDISCKFGKVHVFSTA